VRFGATGLAEALAFSQSDLNYEPRILKRRNHDVDVFFENEPSEEFFRELKALLPQTQVEHHQEEHKDWLAEWKKGFVSFQLAGPFWIVPSWLESPVAPENTIQIDPGMAFGTGTHATTKMASYFVHKVCSQLSDLPDRSLVDVGTGTGILAMLAAKQGVGDIVGVEIDPEARRVARENISLNGLDSILISDLNLEDIRQEFDIVLANIIDGVLIQIRTELLRVLKPHGHLFLTGILLEREEHFFNQFIEKSKLVVRRRIEQDEWVGYWVQRGD